MNNFYRAIRQSLRRRAVLVSGCIFCALMIGVLWGGNIAAVVYPIAEICLKDSTFTTWVDERIEKNSLKIEEIEQKIQQLQSAQPENSRQLAIEEQALSIYQLRDTWYQWSRPYIERYTPKTPFQTVVFLMVIIFVGTVIRIAFLITHSILAAMIARETTREIRQAFYQKALDYEANFYSKEGIAHMLSRFTTDMKLLSHGITILYGKIIREPLKLIACLAGAAFISWQLLLITILIVPPAAWAIRWLAKSIRRVVRKHLEHTAILYARLAETFQSIRVIKVFTQELYEQEKFKIVNDECCRRSMKFARYHALANPMVELFGMLMICLAIIAGAYLAMGHRTDIWGIPVLREPLDMSWLILFFAMLVGASDPARRLSEIYSQFQSAAAAADRIYAMIDRMVPIQDPEDPVPMEQHHVSIRLDNVSFEYEPDRPILEQVSLDIKFGECIAILGASGCGKSTLLSLLPRFADATAGQILIDGVPITSVRIQDLRSQIGLVSQEPILFNMSVRENIRYGRSDATDEEIIEAAKQAFAHDFIEKELPEGYDTVVGPSGGMLSGGQRQRIALARAMLRNPPIFILDEATSQIDIQSERMILEALSAFKKGRTTIMVTHRLSSVDLADRIVVMGDGKILAVGTHAELLQTSPEYAALHR